MTKLGTPIGAGPKGAIVVVGLAGVGVPPAAYWEPPSAAFGARLVAAAVGARCADRRRSVPPPLASPRLSLWVTPPSAVGRCRRFRRPLGRRPAGGRGRCWARPGLGTGADSGSPGCGAGAGVGASLVSVGRFAVGVGSRSLSPSPSSSIPLAQAGACSEGIARRRGRGWVGAELSESGSAPARAAPRALTSRKLAKASISANLVLIPERPCPRSDSPPSGSGWKLPASTGVRNGTCGAPNKALIKVCDIACNGRFSVEPDGLVKLMSTWPTRIRRAGRAAGAGEQAIGELAQALIDNPTLHNASPPPSAPARRRSRPSRRR